MEYKGIEESLKYLVETVSRMEKDIIDLKSQVELRVFTLKEIAAWLGFKSEQSLLNKPWMKPNFGRPDVGYHPRRWFYNTVINWYRVPEEERRRNWETMSSRERRKALGIVKDSNRSSTGINVIEKAG